MIFYYPHILHDMCMLQLHQNGRANFLLKWKNQQCYLRLRPLDICNSINKSFNLRSIWSCKENTLILIKQRPAVSNIFMLFTFLLRWVNLHTITLNSTLDYIGTEACDFSRSVYSEYSNIVRLLSLTKAKNQIWLQFIVMVPLRHLDIQITYRYVAHQLTLIRVLMSISRQLRVRVSRII